MTRRPRVLYLAFYFPPSRGQRRLPRTGHGQPPGRARAGTSPSTPHRASSSRTTSTPSTPASRRPSTRACGWCGRAWDTPTGRPTSAGSAGSGGPSPRSTRRCAASAATCPSRSRTPAGSRRCCAHALAEHARRPYDVVVATGNPFASFAAAWMLHRALRIPYVLDYRDAWTFNQFTEEVRYPEGHRAWTWEDRVLRSAAEVVFVNDGMRSWYADRYPQAADRMTVVPNGWEPEILGEQASPGDRASTPLRFGYVGTITEAMPIEPLFDAWRLAREQPELRDARLDLYGHLGFFPHQREALLARIPTERGHRRRLPRLGREDLAAAGLRRPRRAAALAARRPVRHLRQGLRVHGHGQAGRLGAPARPGGRRGAARLPAVGVRGLARAGRRRRRAGARRPGRARPHPRAGRRRGRARAAATPAPRCSRRSSGDCAGSPVPDGRGRRACAWPCRPPGTRASATRSPAPSSSTAVQAVQLGRGRGRAGARACTPRTGPRRANHAMVARAIWRSYRELRARAAARRGRSPRAGCSASPSPPAPGPVRRARAGAGDGAVATVLPARRIEADVVHAPRRRLRRLGRHAPDPRTGVPVAGHRARQLPRPGAGRARGPRPVRAGGRARHVRCCCVSERAAGPAGRRRSRAAADRVRRRARTPSPFDADAGRASGPSTALDRWLYVGRMVQGKGSSGCSRRSPSCAAGPAAAAADAGRRRQAGRASSPAAPTSLGVAGRVTVLGPVPHERCRRADARARPAGAPQRVRDVRDDRRRGGRQRHGRAHDAVGRARGDPGRPRGRRRYPRRGVRRRRRGRRGLPRAARARRWTPTAPAQVLRDRYGQEAVGRRLLELYGAAARPPAVPAAPEEGA